MAPRLVEMLQRRRELKARIDAMTAELEGLDRVLFVRVQKLAEAVEGARGVNRSALEDRSRDDSARARQRDIKPLYATRSFNPAKVEIRSALGTLHTAEGTVYLTSSPMDSLTTSPYMNLDVHCRADRSESLSGPSLRDFVPTVTAILEDAGRPMRTGAIYRALLDRGFVMPGKNPTNNLSAHLSNRADAFMSTPDGWALRSPSLIKNREMTSET